MQLELPCIDADELCRQLESLTAMPIQLTLTDNATIMMTFKAATRDGPARLRLHRMFLAAGPDVLRALACWITNTRHRRAGRLLDAFIEAHQYLVEPHWTRRPHLKTRGVHHDLQRLYDEVNGAHFEGQVNTPITWGRTSGRRRRRSIRLGSYSPEDRLIRIHPHLDRGFVPEFFVRYVVYHEMLHAHIGFETTPSGRRLVHTRTFCRLERAYPDYERAIAWHDNPRNLARLLRPHRKSV